VETISAKGPNRLELARDDPEMGPWDLAGMKQSNEDECDSK
jgi:hypothetical protein